MESEKVNPRMWKIMAYGAVIALVTDYFVGPSLRKNLNL